MQFVKQVIGLGITDVLPAEETKQVEEGADWNESKINFVFQFVEFFRASVGMRVSGFHAGTGDMIVLSRILLAVGKSDCGTVSWTIGDRIQWVSAELLLRRNFRRSRW